MQKKIIYFILALLPVYAVGQQGWTGTFQSKYGELKLVEENGNEYPGGNLVYGDYGNKGTLVGSLKENGNRLEGYFFNGNASGRFSFSRSGDKKGFTGTWGYGEQMNLNTSDADFHWTGTQQSQTRPANLVNAIWSGKWNTSQGFVILRQVGNKISGKYHTVGTIDATYNPLTRKVTGTFANNGKKGYLEWELLDNEYRGKWGWTTALTGGEWTGTKQVKSNKATAPAASASAAPSTTSANTSSNTGNETVRFSIRPVSLSSLGSIYGFAGVQVFRLTQNGSEEIKSFGLKSQYFFNTTEDKVVAASGSHTFPNTLDYQRDFLISKEDLSSDNTELQLKLYFHLKKKQLGRNKDYRYKSVIINLKTLQSSEVRMRSDVGPEIVQFNFSVKKS